MEALLAGLIQLPAEVGPLQVGLTVFGCGMQYKNLGRRILARLEHCAEGREQSRGLQRRMDGIASARMGELEIKQLRRCDAASGSPQAYASWRQAAQPG
jgi:hypothetical protein